MKKMFLIILFLFFCNELAFSQTNIIPGAERLNLYLSYLKNKRVGVFANQTSLVGKEPLVDVLLRHHIHVVKIFSPEHGFLGNKEGGDDIKNKVHIKTGLPIVSMYGKKFKPSAEDLKDVDVLVFDIQDVGVRFYTYIASLQKLMEAAVDNHKPLIILDRPNPNGFYVDGPVLEPKFRSFTGMQPVPIVYGMTMGEYAKMLVGERWLMVKPKASAALLHLIVIPCGHYTHNSLYAPPVRPSPNLPDVKSIYWYPAIGLLETTHLSVGRGTSTPFQVLGHPLLHEAFTFVPTVRPEALSPPLKNKICHGWNLRGDNKTILKKINGKFQLIYLLRAYQLFPDKKHFF